MKQLHAQDYLLELLKFFSNKEEFQKVHEDIIIKVLNCLALVVRNTQIGKQLFENYRDTKGLLFLLDFAQEHKAILEKSESLFDSSLVKDIQQLSGVLNVIRVLLIADRNEVTQQIPTLQTFTGSVLSMLASKISKAVERNELTESEKEKEPCKAVLKLFKTCVYADYFASNDFDLAYDEKKVAKDFDAIFKNQPQLMTSLNAMRVGEKGTLNSAYFVDNYLDYHLDEESGKCLDVIEFVRPPSGTSEEIANFKQEVRRRNTTHWSMQLALVSFGHLQTINHKFETWK